MADPFSVATGALTVVDVCVRVGKYLRSVSKAAKNSENDIEALEREISNFSSVYTAIRQICATNASQRQLPSRSPSGLDDPGNALLARAADLVQEGLSLVQKLRDHLLYILGSETSTKFQQIDSLRKGVRLLSKDSEYTKLRQRFTNLNLELNTMLTAIDLASNSLYHSQTLTSLEQLPGKLSLKLQELEVRLKAQVEVLEKADGIDPSVEPSILSAKAAIAFASLNEHFYVQKPDTSIWTGRKRHLDILRDAMLSYQPGLERTQKRFVIQGISGAGKTQFCCKFAQDYRESFWGIFWVDASSVRSATESWKRIAKIGGKDVNEEAGKYWLSNLQSPWLLVIDGANNSEESIQTQFPSGDRGYILITTHNPRLKIHATVGSLTLDKLEENEADELLRKATKHEPWDTSAKASALSIANHLGYLPLALIHAGRAIFHKLCTLQGYIPFVDRILSDYRRKRNITFEDDNGGMGAFTSFDVIYSGLEAQAARQTLQGRMSQDATELINMFAFLHNNDIRLEILVRAGKNLQQAAQGAGWKSLLPQTSAKPLFQRLKGMALVLYMWSKRPRPALPQMFKASKDNRGPFDESRARKAIDLLVRMSLLSESSENGSYSVHPLVHMWVRKRLHTSAQALWCGAAADVLASSIKIPPMTDGPGDQDFYVRMLNHVNQVQGLQRELKFQLQQNRQEASHVRSLVWMSNPWSFSTIDAVNCAKYSRVYMECSMFQHALTLQALVRDFIVKNLGDESPFIVPISNALSMSLWHLGRAAEAQELQETALRICQSELGNANPQTLKVMDSLGETYWQRGFLKQAKALHQMAISGMEGRPELTRDRFKAMTHLGHVHEWYDEQEIARDIHEKASGGLAEAYGNDDFDALTAKDSLAMTLLQLDGVSNVKRANVLMQDIYDSRRKRLGVEHAYTLWAACNLARTLTERGRLEDDQTLLDEARAIFNDGIAIARRNLGPNHVGTLMGRGFLANVLVVEKAYAEAEQEFKDIAEQQRQIQGARNGTHRDRLITLQRMVHCYEIQGKLKEAVECCNTIITELDGLGGQEHPWRLQIVEKREGILNNPNTPADSTLSGKRTIESVSGQQDKPAPSVVESSQP